MIRVMVLLGALLPFAASAQNVDVDALLSKIDQRSGQYQQLIEILQGADAARALAAFDAMLESGDKTLRETAISAAMSSTDERLRARALWETLATKDSITVVIAADGLDDDARAALGEWVGAVSTWGVTDRFADTQCVNLYSTAKCAVDYHLSVSGLKVDMRYKGTLTGGFTLNSEGVLVGEVMNPETKVVYAASVQLR